MFELLPLIEGWEYKTKSIINPEIYTSKQITLLDEKDKSGWFISAEVISNDKHLKLQMWINNVLVATNSPQGFYYGGSRLIEGVPNTFLYGQIIPGTNMKLYGMSMFTVTGYPYNKSIKVALTTELNELFIESYQIFYIEITDKQKFIEGLRAIYGNDTIIKTLTGIR